MQFLSHTYHEAYSINTNLASIFTPQIIPITLNKYSKFKSKAYIDL